MSNNRQLRSPIKKVHTIHEDQIKNYFGPENFYAEKKDKRFEKLNPIIVCFTNRSGSNMLCEDLSHLPRCGYGRELLNHDGVKRISKRDGCTTFPDYVFHILNLQNRKIPVIKASIDQLLFLYESGVLNNCLYNARIIHIKRADLLSQAVSFFITSVTKEWGSGHDKTEETPTFDEKRILTMLQNISRANARFDAAFSLFGIPHHVVVYENYIKNRHKNLTDIAKFIGSDPAEIMLPEKRMRKRQSSSDKSQFIDRIRDKYFITR